MSDFCLKQGQGLKRLVAHRYQTPFEYLRGRSKSKYFSNQA